jgi:hypothetical protein
MLLVAVELLKSPTVTLRFSLPLIDLLKKTCEVVLAVFVERVGGEPTRCYHRGILSLTDSCLSRKPVSILFPESQVKG